MPAGTRDKENGKPAIDAQASLRAALCSVALLLLVWLLWSQNSEEGGTGGTPGVSGEPDAAELATGGTGGTSSSSGSGGDEGEGKGSDPAASPTGGARDGQPGQGGDRENVSDASGADAAGGAREERKAPPVSTTPQEPPDAPGMKERPPLEQADSLGTTQPSQSPNQPPANPDAASNLVSLPKLSGNSAPSSGSPSGEWKGGNFFEMDGDAKSVVYVVDTSSSMGGGKLDRTRQELIEALRNLREDQSFYVVFFNNNAIRMPGSGLQPATLSNLANVISWIDSQVPHGGTDPTDAIDIALGLRPEVIWVLSDGGFNARVVADTKGKNGPNGPIVINTIGFWNSHQTLKELAAQNRGEYRYVPR